MAMTRLDEVAVGDIISYPEHGEPLAVVTVEELDSLDLGGVDHIVLTVEAPGGTKYALRGDLGETVSVVA